MNTAFATTASAPLRMASAVPFPAAATTEPTGRKKLLLADDNSFLQKMTATKLRAAGYDVVTAADGAEALSTARSERPDFMILNTTYAPDVAHGGGVNWTGYLVVEWMRRSEELSHIPFMMLTNEDPAAHQERAAALGAVALYQKPVRPEELLSVIGECLAEPVTS